MDYLAVFSLLCMVVLICITDERDKNSDGAVSVAVIIAATLIIWRIFS